MSRELIFPEQKNPRLFAELQRWYRQNMQGGWQVVWRRRPVWSAQLAQKMGFQLETNAPLFFGDTMRVYTREGVSAGLLTFGYTEVALTALMLIVVGRDQAVVDIGTHFGYVGLLASRLVGPGGKVDCFEPNPLSLEMARKNLRGIPHVDIHEKAVSDRPGQVFLAMSRSINDSSLCKISAAGEQTGNRAVEATTLDRMFSTRSRPVDFLKCDAEGSELNILKGADAVLKRADRPMLVLEGDMPSAQGELSSRTMELLDHLKGYGYHGLVFDFDGELHVGAPGSFPVHHANVLCLPAEQVELLKDRPG
ncbi:MAG: FkbM family methyltransferase [Magnetococcales bacterium]|nr:FkbM family methyltransferase [Magnetococcales bacterium]